MCEFNTLWFFWLYFAYVSVLWGERVVAVGEQAHLYPSGQDIGDRLATAGDDKFDNVTLSHAFTFYGTEYTTLFVSPDRKWRI